MDELFSTKPFAYAREKHGVIEVSRTNHFQGGCVGFPLYSGQQVLELIKKAKDRAYQEGVDSGWDQHRISAARDDDGSSFWES